MPNWWRSADKKNIIKMFPAILPLTYLFYNTFWVLLYIYWNTSTHESRMIPWQLFITQMSFVPVRSRARIFNYILVEVTKCYFLVGRLSCPFVYFITTTMSSRSFHIYVYIFISSNYYAFVLLQNNVNIQLSKNILLSIRTINSSNHLYRLYLELGNFSYRFE